jgi:hypothetical protein
MTAATPNETEAIALRSTLRDMILPGGLSESFQVLIHKRQE